MNTLLGFLTFTKAITYLVAISYVFAFIAFWQLMQYKGKGLKGLLVRVVPAAVLALGVVILADKLISASTVTIPSPPSTETHLLSSSVLADLYGPASFDHDSHLGGDADCTLCHHFSEDRTPRCEECHAYSPEDPHQPSLTHVYHLRCISCHKERQVGPTGCTGCHTESAIAPLSIAHPLTGEENCISCHGAGIPGMPGLPDDHASATNGVCQLCHKVSVHPEALARRELPHEIARREDCLLCHGEGIGGAQRVPADHAGRANDTCQLCHEPPGAEGAPALAPSPAAPALGELPHEVAGREDCLMCHEEGIAGAKQVPADHAGKANDTCQLCHEPPAAEGTPALAPSPTAPALGELPHEVAGREDCLMCHEEGIGGAQQVPADHAGKANDTCQLCHKPSAE